MPTLFTGKLRLSDIGPVKFHTVTDILSYRNVWPNSVFLQGEVLVSQDNYRAKIILCECSTFISNVHTLLFHWCPVCFQDSVLVNSNSNCILSRSSHPVRILPVDVYMQAVYGRKWLLGLIINFC